MVEYSDPGIYASAAMDGKRAALAVTNPTDEPCRPTMTDASAAVASFFDKHT